MGRAIALWHNTFLAYRKSQVLYLASLIKESQVAGDVKDIAPGSQSWARAVITNLVLSRLSFAVLFVLPVDNW